MMRLGSVAQWITRLTTNQEIAESDFFLLKHASTINYVFAKHVAQLIYFYTHENQNPYIKVTYLKMRIFYMTNSLLKQKKILQ